MRVDGIEIPLEVEAAGADAVAAYLDAQHTQPAAEQPAPTTRKGSK